MPKIDLTGQRFGRLVVLKEAGRAKNRKVLWFLSLRLWPPNQNRQRKFKKQPFSFMWLHDRNSNPWAYTRLRTLVSFYYVAQYDPALQ